MFLLNVMLALAWSFLTGEFTPINFFFGFLIGFMLLWLVDHSLPGAGAYAQAGIRIPRFFLFFLYQLIMANLRVTYDVITPRHHMRPGIVAMPLEAASDIEITLLANLISLTPGTLSLDVSDDRRFLYIHGMYIEEPESFCLAIKEDLERPLLEVLRWKK